MEFRKKELENILDNDVKTEDRVGIKLDEY